MRMEISPEPPCTASELHRRLVATLEQAQRSRRARTTLGLLHGLDESDVCGPWPPRDPAALGQRLADCLKDTTALR